MNKYLYKYVEYNCITDKPYIIYLSVDDILDIEPEILKIRGLEPEKNRLILSPDLYDKNRWYFTWETDFPFGVKNVNVRPGYIEKIDSDLDDVSGIFKNVEKLGGYYE